MNKLRLFYFVIMLIMIMIPVKIVVLFTSLPAIRRNDQNITF